MPLILISLASSHRLIHYLLVRVKNSTQSPLVISCNIDHPFSAKVGSSTYDMTNKIIIL